MIKAGGPFVEGCRGGRRGASAYRRAAPGLGNGPGLDAAPAGLVRGGDDGPSASVIAASQRVGTRLGYEVQALSVEKELPRRARRALRVITVSGALPRLSSVCAR